jgi:hypothetical protein
VVVRPIFAKDFDITVRFNGGQLVVGDSSLTLMEFKSFQKIIYCRRAPFVTAADIVAASSEQDFPALAESG